MTNSEYNNYVDLYKQLSIKQGSPIIGKKLTQNGLPCVSTFLKYCPDPNIKTWNDFVIWCGFQPTKMLSKEQAAFLLIQYDKTIDRPIRYSDLNTNDSGVTTHILKKYWKNMRTCQLELGLKISPTGNNQRSFDYFKTKLDNVIDSLKSVGKQRITWKDIIYNKVGGFNYDSLNNAFLKEGISVVEYIQNNGLSFWKSGQGKENYYMYSDGESTSSSYEYDFSNFLRNNNFVFQRDYNRNVLYKNIINTNRIIQKIDCDYLFYNVFVIEIAGLLSNKNGDWHNHRYKTKREQEYKEKMILKERLLLENNIPFLFLFPEDFKEDCAFQQKTIEFILSNLHKYQLIQKS